MVLKGPIWRPTSSGGKGYSAERAKEGENSFSITQFNASYPLFSYCLYIIMMMPKAEQTITWSLCQPLVMKLIYADKVYQIHSTMCLALRINEDVRVLVLNELSLFSPFCLFIYSNSINWETEKKAVRKIMRGHLTLGDQGSLPEEVAFGWDLKDKELVQEPGMGRENAELAEQRVQSPGVGKGWLGWLESREGGPVCMRGGDKVPSEVML